VSENRILIAPDGVDFDRFRNYESRIKKSDKKIVMYVGSLQRWKGVDVLTETAKKFSDDTLFVFVGGDKKDVTRYSLLVAGYSNVRFVEFQPHKEIPGWLKSADVLVLPNSAKEKISKFYTSPMKLFEYMASGVPIVASNLPSIREILNEENSVLVEPDNPDALTEGIKKVLQNSELAVKISRQAYQDVQNHTWKKRAQKILNFIKL